MTECGVNWLGHNAPCMLEQGHKEHGQFEHKTKVKLIYPDGHEGNVEIIWMDAEGLREPSK